MSMEQMNPKQIVAELDKYVIGQDAAKRAVAVAIRNRWRRQQLDKDLAREISPTNIIMIGPTGVGKTEIARRISSLTGAPFIKIEATKFTEVGYHGRDVESIVRDLVEQAVAMVRSEQALKVEQDASDAVEEQLLDLLLPETETDLYDDESTERREQTRQRLRDKLRSGDLENREVEVTLSGKAVPTTVFSNMGIDQMDPDMANMFEKIIPDQTQTLRT
ncbi:MAG: AAA family ATPase, partial [Phycisphaeraceae bacterium]|nr:AAA family ATPase [Phycisphaeraceae bacterium]